MASALPVIDLGSPDDVVVAAIRDAYERLGFGYVIGHGVEPDLVAEVFEQSRRFHALPLERKAAVELDRLHRGYIPIDASTDVTSTLAEVTKPNQSESFMMMREAGPQDPQVMAGAYLAGPNQWPEGLPGFREVVQRYHDAMCTLGHRLVALMAQSIGDHVGAIASTFDPPTTWLRLLRYPPRPADAPDDLYGSAPHLDFGCVTILAQDELGGLEVRSPQGTWLDAAPMPEAFVVNVGSMLHRWSNGRLLATAHRVVNRSGRERYSVPFFFDPSVDTVVAPLDSCIDADRGPLFSPVHFGEFLRHELESSYRHHHGEHQRST